MSRLKTLRPRLGSSRPSTGGGWSATHRGSRHERGYGWDWEQRRARVLVRDAGLCQPCRRRGVMTPGCRTVDHIVPKARGGGDDEANLQTICSGPGSCHQAKTQAESQGLAWDEGAPIVQPGSA
jgi:5-methylcytosine-specific restriction enzyme A